VEFERLLTKLLRILETDQIPAEAHALLHGGVLYPLRKANGGIRPIVVGNIFIKAIGKAIVKTLSKKFQEFFLPRGQVGVATPGGTDALIHAVRLATISHPDWHAVQLDFKNAFNEISRDLIWRQLQAHFPELCPYFRLRYGSPTKLLMMGDPIPIFSSTGVQQGDPLGPFFFSLALQAVIDDRPKDPSQPQIILGAYLDDIVLVGPLPAVAVTVDALIHAGAVSQSNLSLRFDKCTVWSPSMSPLKSQRALSSIRSEMGDRLRFLPDPAQLAAHTPPQAPASSSWGPQSDRSSSPK
jgi:hypothetical protein